MPNRQEHYLSTSPKDIVSALMGTIDLRVANKLLGGPIEAARQRRAAGSLGESEDELYKTQGSLKGKFGTTTREIQRTKEKEVEKYKLTPETLAFIREYKKVNKVSNMLNSTMQVQLLEADATKELLKQVEGVRNQMLLQAPQKPTFEVEGQDIDNFRINY